MELPFLVVTIELASNQSLSNTSPQSSKLTVGINIKILSYPVTKQQAHTETDGFMHCIKPS